MRQKEGRTVGLYTKVTPEEKALIDQKMSELGTTNLRAYLRKMAVDGYIVNLDMNSLKWFRIFAARRQQSTFKTARNPLHPISCVDVWSAGIVGGT